MRARHAVSRSRLVCASLLIAGLFAGCGGGPAKDTGVSSSVDLKGGARRREQADYFKNQTPGAKNKP